jgi:hypothetical protein
MLVCENHVRTQVHTDACEQLSTLDGEVDFRFVVVGMDLEEEMRDGAGYGDQRDVDGVSGEIPDDRCLPQVVVDEAFESRQGVFTSVGASNKHRHD